ncbi:MAG: IS5 family transposase [Ktedonobacteraceae bacterium]|nr:IS5 family transposase [Ktedonobacteraceae bacterium]MBO0789639.1 IS5 family transposase [Ktedonobacteraceae bacterium]
MRMTMGRRAYASDVTDEQWSLLEPLIPVPSLEGRLPIYERREIVNAILYVLRSGCPWRLLPHEFPAWGTVYWYFRRWRREGVWDQILDALRRRVRERQGRDAEPSAAIIESQSIKTSAVRGPEKGYDMGKKSLGSQAPRARGYGISHLLAVKVTGAHRSEKPGRPSLVGTVEGGFSQDEAHVGR